MRQELNYILNYNSKSSDFSTNWGNIFSHVEKECSQAIAQIFRSKAIFRTLLVALMMVCNFVGAWAQVTATTDLNDKHLYLIQTNQFESFYITPNGNNLNTVNLPHGSMLWYFL